MRKYTQGIFQETSEIKRTCSITKINFGKKKTNKTTQEKKTTKIFFFKADTSSVSEFSYFLFTPEAL